MKFCRDFEIQINFGMTLAIYLIKMFSKHFLSESTKLMNLARNFINEFGKRLY